MRWKDFLDDIGNLLEMVEEDIMRKSIPSIQRMKPITRELITNPGNPAEEEIGDLVLMDMLQNVLSDESISRNQASTLREYPTILSFLMDRHSIPLNIPREAVLNTENMRRVERTPQSQREAPGNLSETELEPKILYKLMLNNISGES